VLTQQARGRPAISLELFVKRRPAQVVREIAQGRETDAKHDVEGCLVREAGFLESREFIIRDASAGSDDCLGEAGDGIELGVAHRRPVT
jgi:hypothetical protein